MKYSQAQEFEYIFKKILGHKSSLVFKMDGRLATANFIDYDVDGVPFKIKDDNLDVKFIKQYDFVKNIEQYFKWNYTPNKWDKNPFLCLLVLPKVIANIASRKSDIESDNVRSILYNFKYLDDTNVYEFYLVDDDQDFEFVSVISAD